MSSLTLNQMQQAISIGQTLLNKNERLEEMVDYLQERNANFQAEIQHLKMELEASQQSNRKLQLKLASRQDEQRPLTESEESLSNQQDKELAWSELNEIIQRQQQEICELRNKLNSNAMQKSSLSLPVAEKIQHSSPFELQAFRLSKHWWTFGKPKFISATLLISQRLELKCRGHVVNMDEFVLLIDRNETISSNEGEALILLKVVSKRKSYNLWIKQDQQMMPTNEKIIFL